MSVEIEEVTIGSVTERRLVLSNAHWAAKMDILNDWEILRVGCRMTFDTPAGSIYGTPRFYLGLLSNPTIGLTNGMLDPQASTHFWGMRTNSPQWGDSGAELIWTMQAGMDFVKAEAGVSTVLVSDLFGTFDYISSAPDTIRTAVMIEFRRESGGVIDAGAVIPAGTGDFDDVSYEKFLGAMETSTMEGAASAIGGSQYDEVFGTGYFCDEDTYGPLNSIYIGWDRTAPALHVSEMLFTKFA